MQQIADWLEKLGMSEYEQRFADNDIDLSILPELTDQDLEKIGVASLGHRRKILKATALLNAGQAAEAPAVPAAGSVVRPLYAQMTLRPGQHTRGVEARGNPESRINARPSLQQQTGRKRRGRF